jgi:short-subunit dehydrogenase
MELRNRVVILTGASSGIGLATAHILARAGARLALVARNAHALDALAEQLRKSGVDAYSFPTDIRDRGAVERMIAVVFAQFGAIDVLLNNAGQAAVGELAELSGRDFQAIFEVNVLGPLYAMQAVVPKMREAGGGLIVNVSSPTAYLNIPTIGAYAATKAALDVMSNTARVELARDNIRVVTVYPGRVDTALNASARGSQAARARAAQRGGGDAFRVSAETVGEKIREAIEHEPRNQHMNGQGRAFLAVARAAPRVVERMIARGARKTASAGP